MDVAKAMDPANNLTTNALIENVPTWASGAVGLALTADGEHMIVGHARRTSRRRAAGTSPS